jgi:ABC-type transporter Mla subunit MlaD
MKDFLTIQSLRKMIVLNPFARTQPHKDCGHLMPFVSIESRPRSENEPPIVSANSAPTVQSTERKSHMLTLTEIAAAITKAPAIITSAIAAIGSAVTAVETIAADVAKLIGYIPDLMQTFENAYAAVGQSDNGAGKLAGVLAALQGVAAKIAADWNDTIKAVVTNIIAQAKSAYNSVVTAFSTSQAATA